MPHLNHRRGDTRRNVRNSYEGRWIVANMGGWNRIANRKLRTAVSRVLQILRARSYDGVEDTMFPVAREADNIWNYD